MGNPVLANRVFRENQLCLMLRNHGVELIFLPPYSPELNSCEFCRSVKVYLRQHEKFSIDFTELAIIQSWQTITPVVHSGFFNFTNYLFHSLANPTQRRVMML